MTTPLVEPFWRPRGSTGVYFGRRVLALGEDRLPIIWGNGAAREREKVVFRVFSYPFIGAKLGVASALDFFSSCVAIPPKEASTCQGSVKKRIHVHLFHVKQGVVLFSCQ